MKHYNETVLWIGVILISLGFGFHGGIVGYHLGEMRKGVGYRHTYSKFEVFLVFLGVVSVIAGLAAIFFA